MVKQGPFSCLAEFFIPKCRAPQEWLEWLPADLTWGTVLQI